MTVIELDELRDLIIDLPAEVRKAEDFPDDVPFDYEEILRHRRTWAASLQDLTSRIHRATECLKPDHHRLAINIGYWADAGLGLVRDAGSKPLRQGAVEDWERQSADFLHKLNDITTAILCVQQPAADDKAPDPTRAPLGTNAALLYDHLLTLPEHRAMLPKAIEEWFVKQHKILVGQSVITKEILPVLKPYGLLNKPRIGYYIPLNARPPK